MKKLIEAKNLCFSYYKKPLTIKDANLEINEGERVLLFALDGEGKTTIVNVLSGFDDTYFGSLLFTGNEMKKIRDEEKDVSIIYSEPVLVRGSINKNFDYLCKVLNRAMTQQERENLLSDFQINSELKCKIKKLSYFDKIKFCILRAFVKQSKIVYLDNIFEKLNYDEQKIVFELIDKNLKKSTIFLTCNEKFDSGFLKLVNNFGVTKVLYLSSAKLFEYKTVDEFFCINIDINVEKFARIYKKTTCFAFFDGMSYYLLFEDGNQIKIDKKLNSVFSKLELEKDGDEKIHLEYKENLELDLTNDELVNKLLLDKTIALFLDFDGTRLV